MALADIAQLNEESEIGSRHQATRGGGKTPLSPDLPASKKSSQHSVAVNKVQKSMQEMPATRNSAQSHNTT